MVVVANDTAVIDCCIKGKATNYKWYKNGMQIPEKVAGSDGKILFIPELEQNDSGVYTCIAGKTNGVILHHVLVLVQGKKSNLHELAYFYEFSSVHCRLSAQRHLLQWYVAV